MQSQAESEDPDVFGRGRVYVKNVNTSCWKGKKLDLLNWVKGGGGLLVRLGGMTKDDGWELQYI